MQEPFRQRSPGCRRRNTERRRRQGHLRNKAHRSHYVLPEVEQASRTLYPTPLQGKASRVYYLMMRLCAFVEQITLPRAIRWRQVFVHNPG